MSGLPGPAWPGAARPIPKEPAVLEDAVVRKVLGAALATGGEWAEVYAEDRLSHNIRLEDRRVEELVSRADDAARAYDPAVAQVSAGYGDVRQQVLVANSEGFTTVEERVRTRFVVQVVAVRDGVVQTGFDGPGRSQGFELLEEFPPELVARKAAERAVAMLASRPAPAGEMPVVIASGNGGVLFHESSGHGMEADLVAKEASVYHGKQGKQIGVRRFNGVDDGTVEGAWGSFAFDDEGTPAQRTVLFENGVCTDYLTDLIRARQLGLRATGNGRRQSYAEVPIPRMTN